MPSPTPFLFTASGSISFFLHSSLLAWPGAESGESGEIPKPRQSTEIHGLTKVKQWRWQWYEVLKESRDVPKKSASTEPVNLRNTEYIVLVHAVLRLVAARRETVASTWVSDVSLECFGLVRGMGSLPNFIDMSSEAVNLVQIEEGMSLALVWVENATQWVVVSWLFECSCKRLI